MTTVPVLRDLPADFRSFYRLFRRACSASVLQRNAESTALRNLYRTTFRRAGLIYMRAKNNAVKDGEMKERQEAWLTMWNKRMDNTLSFLYNSSHTRGLAHQTTKFMGHFIYWERRRHNERKNRGLVWNGQLPPDAPQYKPPPPKKPSQIAKEARTKALSAFEEEALGPVREVVRMAEGRDELLFGNLKNYTRPYLSVTRLFESGFVYDYDDLSSMPVSVYTDDDRSPRTELLSPSSASPSQPSPSSARDRHREHRLKAGGHRRNDSPHPHTANASSHTSGSYHDNRNRNNTSKAWWRSREQALSQPTYSKQDLIRMIISAERETSKLHGTLTNTLTLLDTESHRCATLERDSFNAFTRLANMRETAESLAEHTAQDLRVAQFELEHKAREVKRLQQELDMEKNAREEAEREGGRARDVARELRRERAMERAREHGRREGFEKGFIKAQAENALKMQAGARPSAAEGTLSYEELDSVPIITPPPVLPDGQIAPTKTGYSPIQRPIPHRFHDIVPQRESAPTPSVDRYPISIPPQSVIEQTHGIGQPEKWVTGAEHSAFHGPTPPNPATLTINTNPSNDATAAVQLSPTSPKIKKSQVKFQVHRPSLKQAAASWYRSLSFRKKPKQKILIDPEEEDDDEAGYSSAPLASADAGLGSVVTAPPARPQSQRQSRVVSVNDASLEQKINASQGKHKPRVSSLDSRASTHISTSQFDLLNTPGGSNGGYLRGGQVNGSAASLSSLGRPASLSGKSARSQAGGIPKKLSVIRENPMSRNTTPIGAPFTSVSGPTLRGSANSRESLLVRPYASKDGDWRSMKSGKSTNSRMFAVNPDPESPDLQKSFDATGVGTSSPRPANPQRQRQQKRPSQEPYVLPRPPPADSALLRPASVQSGGSSARGSRGFPVVAPLRTKKSGISNASGSGGPIDTPTPMPREDKGKKGLHPLGGGNDTSPKIEIAVQTPSDHARDSGPQDGIEQDARFLSPRQMPRSTPKILSAQGLPGVESAAAFEERRPTVTVLERFDGAAIFGGGAGSVVGSESGQGNSNHAGMTPGPALFPPLRLRASAGALPEQQRYLNGAGVYLRPERAGSVGSLRSQGSYGKYDSSKYVDPAFWGSTGEG